VLLSRERHQVHADRSDGEVIAVRVSAARAHAASKARATTAADASDVGRLSETAGAAAAAAETEWLRARVEAPGRACLKTQPVRTDSREGQSDFMLHEQSWRMPLLGSTSWVCITGWGVEITLDPRTGGFGGDPVPKRTPRRPAPRPVTRPTLAPPPPLPTPSTPVASKAA